MIRKFVLLDVFKVAWKKYISQIWILTGLIIGCVIVNLALNLYIPPPQHGNMSAAGLALALFSLVFSLLFSLGYTKNIFQTLDGEEPQFSAYGQEIRKIITLFLTGLIYAVTVVLGIALLLFPGFYLAIRFQFFYASIVEEDTGIISSLKRSWEITKGQEKPLFILLFAEIAIAILGLIVFIIGIFVTIPLIGLMNCYVFRKLTAFTTEEVTISD